jgi:bla regulator protein blaR1
MVSKGAMKLLALVLLAVTTAIARSPAQTPQSAPPAFAVASIKPSPPPSGGSMFVDHGSRPGGQWFAQNTELLSILRTAYPAFSLPGQIVGGPDWVSSQRFDVNARAEGNPSSESMSAMLRQLLADRFSLKVRTEQRDVDVYALVLDRADRRLGPGMMQSTTDCRAIEEARKKAAETGAPPTPAPNVGVKPQCGMRSTSMNCVQRISTGSMPVGAITTPIQSVVGRSVLDRTGLTGRWDIELQFMCPAGLQVAQDQPNAPASVFTAVQEQLGLKLEPRKEKMDVLVIDHVQMPTPN